MTGMTELLEKWKDVSGGTADLLSLIRSVKHFRDWPNDEAAVLQAILMAAATDRSALQNPPMLSSTQDLVASTLS